MTSLDATSTYVIRAKMPTNIVLDIWMGNLGHTEHDPRDRPPEMERAACRHVANDVETEQMVSAGLDRKTGATLLSSVVQVTLSSVQAK